MSEFSQSSRWTSKKLLSSCPELRRCSSIGSTDILAAPERASLRRYIARFGFECVSAALGTEQADYVAAYGSLRQGFALPDEPGELAQLLTSEGPCLINGELYDMGDYPGLVAGDGHVVGELYRLSDLKALRLIDRFERYDAIDPEGSLYLRRCVRLAEPSADAWVYFYNRPVNDMPRVPGDDWARRTSAG